MNTPGQRPRDPVRRMLLALDALNCESALIESAAALAAALGTELEVLFVEDADLYAVAELPITQEISLTTARERAISTRQVSASLKSLSREAERRVRRALEHGRLQGQFRITRARRADALCEACGTVDLLLLLPSRRTLVHLHVERSPRVFAVCSDTPASTRTLELAGRLARRDHREITLLTPGMPDQIHIAELERRGFRVGRQSLPGDAPIEQILAAVANRSDNLLLIAADLPAAANRERLLEALAAMRCQILLVN